LTAANHLKSAYRIIHRYFNLLQKVLLFCAGIKQEYISKFYIDSSQCMCS